MFFKAIAALGVRRSISSQLGRDHGSGDQCWVAWAKSFIMRSLQFSMLLKIFFLQHNQLSDMEWTARASGLLAQGLGVRPVGLCGLCRNWRNELC